MRLAHQLMFKIISRWHAHLLEKVTAASRKSGMPWEWLLWWCLSCYMIHVRSKLANAQAIWQVHDVIRPHFYNQLHWQKLKTVLKQWELTLPAPLHNTKGCFRAQYIDEPTIIGTSCAVAESAAEKSRRCSLLCNNSVIFFHLLKIECPVAQDKPKHVCLWWGCETTFVAPWFSCMIWWLELILAVDSGQPNLNKANLCNHWTAWPSWGMLSQSMQKSF